MQRKALGTWLASCLSLLSACGDDEALAMECVGWGDIGDTGVAAAGDPGSTEVLQGLGTLTRAFGYPGVGVFVLGNNGIAKLEGDTWRALPPVPASLLVSTVPVRLRAAAIAANGTVTVAGQGPSPAGERVSYEDEGAGCSDGYFSQRTSDGLRWCNPADSLLQLVAGKWVHKTTLAGEIDVLEPDGVDGAYHAVDSTYAEYEYVNENRREQLDLQVELGVGLQASASVGSTAAFAYRVYHFEGSFTLKLELVREGKSLEVVDIDHMAPITRKGKRALLVVAPDRKRARIFTEQGWEPSFAFEAYGETLGGEWPALIAFDQRKVARRLDDGTWITQEAPFDAVDLPKNVGTWSTHWVDGEQLYTVREGGVLRCSVGLK